MQGAVYSLFGWPVHTTIARPHHGRLHLLRRANRYSPPAAASSRPAHFPFPTGQLPLPPDQSACRPPRGSRTASPRFPGQRLPTNQRAECRSTIGWRRQGRVRTFCLRFKNLARKARQWLAPPRSCAGLERGQTRAGNHSISAPPPRPPPPLCAGAQLLPLRPQAEREVRNGPCRCPPEPFPGTRPAGRPVPLLLADLSVPHTVGADEG